MITPLSLPRPPHSSRHSFCRPRRSNTDPRQIPASPASSPLPGPFSFAPCFVRARSSAVPCGPTGWLVFVVLVLLASRPSHRHRDRCHCAFPPSFLLGVPWFQGLYSILKEVRNGRVISFMSHLTSPSECFRIELRFLDLKKPHEYSSSSLLEGYTS